MTTVARTLLDVAAIFDHERLLRVIGEAERRGLGDSPSLPDLIERYPGRRGIARLRAVLADGRIGLDVTRSELELRFLRFVRERGLPRPEVNVTVEAGDRRVEVDCLWRDAALVVELDGHAYHGGSRAFEADRARDRALAAVGLRTVRVTWRHLHEQPEALARDLRVLSR